MWTTIYCIHHFNNKKLRNNIFQKLETEDIDYKYHKLENYRMIKGRKHICNKL